MISLENVSQAILALQNMDMDADMLLQKTKEFFFCLFWFIYLFFLDTGLHFVVVQTSLELRAIFLPYPHRARIVGPCQHAPSLDTYLNEIL